MPRNDPSELAAVLDTVDTGLIVLDENARILRWNSWMARASGIAATAAELKSLEDLFPTVEQTRLAPAIIETLRAGTSSVLTHSLHAAIFPLKTPAGSALIHNVSVRPMMGEPARALIQVSDVTVATERDRVLRARQNARYDAVVGSAPDAILTIDTTAMIRLANPAAAREFGYSPNALVGQPVEQLFGDQEAWTIAWDALLAGERMQRPVELVARRKDGSPVFMEMSASRWRADSRYFVTAILRDISERRAAEEALRDLNQTLELRMAERTADRDRMWRLSSDVMLVARLDGRIVSTNPAWNNLVGQDAGALDGQRLESFIVAEDRPNLETALRGLASTPQPQLFELGVEARDGAIRQIAWSAVAADNLLQAVGRDVTAEREAQEALRQVEEALRQSQKMEAIGQLTGGIAHDFNNLLAGIIGSMEILKIRLAARRYENIERFVDAARTSADRAAALTDRLLAFARRQPLNAQPVDVNQLVKGVRDLMRRSLGEQIKLKVSLGSEVWPAYIDSHQLENALLNLVINGRDAMPEGGLLTIRTGNVTHTRPEIDSPDEFEAGDYTVICVEDTGMGMAPDTIAKAFDPFFTTKPVGQGTGLGLSMIYGFAKQSGGYVRIDSELGQGTQAKLYLPRHKGELSDQATQPTHEAPHGSGETVLLVEDDPSVRLLIAEVLHELGYTCLEAPNGWVAETILEFDVRLDLMISDVGLPGLTGHQLAIIGRQHRPQLKVLFVTGYGDQIGLNGAPLPPGTETLRKPFTLDSLGVKIREMIGLGASKGSRDTLN